MDTYQKLSKAGFRIIRKDYARMAIKTISNDGQYSHGWKNLASGFESKAALDRRFEELLQDDKTVDL